MFGFLKNVLNTEKEPIVAKDFEYMISVLESTIQRAQTNPKMKQHLFYVARKVKDTIKSKEVPLGLKQDALAALEKVQQHAMISGKPEDHKFYVEVEEIRR